MLYSGTDPESYITEYTLLYTYEDNNKTKTTKNDDDNDNNQTGWLGGQTIFYECMGCANVWSVNT